MKIKNLTQDYLQGLIDAIIANYNEHQRGIPAEKYLVYSIKVNRGVVPATTIAGNSTEVIQKTSAKITFSWIPESREVCVDSETNSYENRGESTEDYFTILAGERIIKLQNYVEDILDKVTV